MNHPGLLPERPSVNPPRILLLDIETAPNSALVWGLYEQDVIEVERNWYILSFAYKWLDQKKITTRALPDYPGYRPGSEDDGKLVRALGKLLDEADIVIAHNGDRFDLRKINARLIAHGLKPSRPYKTIDTLKIARKHFAFDSNKLDYIAQYLKIGRKLPHTGKHLWIGCMAGVSPAWKKMRRYNAHDVFLLEGVYLRLRAWATSHPDLNVWSGLKDCPACQSSNIIKRGLFRLKSGVKPRLSCEDCGRWFVGEKIKEA